MAVYYDTESGTFAISPDNCPDCEGPLYDTGCDAPGCLGRSCPDCGTGCDIEADPEHGTCTTVLAGERDEDHGARADAERATFGLRPLSTEGEQ